MRDSTFFPAIDHQKCSGGAHPSLDSDGAVSFKEIILENETWLMHRILHYARSLGYARYTSTLLEAWKVSISGLSMALIRAAESGESLEMHCEQEDPIQENPLTQFALAEADLHRQRGIDIGMFLGLFKYYRRCYQDLLQHLELVDEVTESFDAFILSAFDKLEVAICSYWHKEKETNQIRDMQSSSRALANEKNKYLTIFESLSSPVVFLDARGKVDNVNFACAQLISASNVPGEMYYDRTSFLARLKKKQHQGLVEAKALSGQLSIEEMFPAAADTLHTLLESDSLNHIEICIETEGKEQIFSVASRRLLDVSGKFEGTVLIFSDITELRGYQDQLQQMNNNLESANAELSAFVHAVSHDLRAPLRRIRDYLSLVNLQDDSVDKAEVQKYLDTACSMAGDAKALVDDLLRLSRISNAALQRETVDVSSVVTGIGKLLVAEYNNRHSLYVQPGVAANADPGMMKILLENLLSNAFKYSKDSDKPEIRIETASERGEQCILVRDNGAGFPQEHAELLFQPFMRLHRRNQFDGTGIGLATALRIVKRHGGRIWAEGQPGQGAAFYFTLSPAGCA